NADTYSTTIAIDAYGKPGGLIASRDLTGGGPSKYCEGELECGLIVTPYYVHITGTREFGASCNAPQPSEKFEMWLPQLGDGGARIEYAPCAKGTTNGLSLCPDVTPWAEQIVLSGSDPNFAAGEFAKLESSGPHGLGTRYRVRFNSDNTKFGIRGQALLKAVNERVYPAGSATAHAHNWQEWTDEFSDIAEFDFDAKNGRSDADLASEIASVVDSVSGLANSGDGFFS
ncbi:MAG: hypothetical protein Q9224_005632, partial [Gallowayella concinna]